MKRTPLRSALKPGSSLQESVQDGLGALNAVHRLLIDELLRTRFEDSLEIDENLKSGREGEHRWDYLLGDSLKMRIIGLEPHGAADKEVKVLIAKQRAALSQLRDHLREGQRVAAWFWVQSSGSGFKETDKSRRLANQSGITFVGRKLMKKHLDGLV